ncbi:MAG: DNA polymerase III subunit delta [Lachnospiraceae bacterium]|nr:DNA polymerase III subunit delta [Lachnospiraceae bacterium]
MKSINQDIKDRNFKRTYLLFGEEEYLKRRYKHSLIEAIAGDDTMNKSFYEGKGIDVNEVIDMAETMPFFADYKLLVIEDSGFFKSSQEKLAEYVKNIPETTVILFVESEVDKRSKMFKAVKAAGYVCEMGRQDEKSLAIWAAKIINSHNKKITQNNMTYLLGKVGTDMELLSNEIEKLVDYCGSREIIEKSDIDVICTTQLSVKIFDMIDAISAKDSKKTLECYYELIESKEPPERILFMIIRQFNLMIQAKDLSARGMGQAQIAQAMGVQSFIVGKTIRQSKNFTLAELKNGLRDSVEIDEMFKNSKMDKNMGIELLLVKYSSKVSIDK